MTLNDKHIAIALRGVVDERTKKLARALAGAGAQVVVHAFTFNREKHTGQIFRVVYHDSVEPQGSQLSLRVLRVAHNLTIKKLQEGMHVAQEGTFGYKSISRVLVADKPDLIIAINADTLAACALAAQKLSIKFVYESYEFWPDHAKEEACKLDKGQRDFVIQSERYYARNAELMVTVSDYLAQEYVAELWLATTPLVVHNAPEAIADTPSPAHDMLSILFLGNIQRERGVEYLLRGVASTQGCTLTYQGQGAMRNELESLAVQLGVSDRVFFKEPVPYEQIAESASEYDVGVVCHQAYNRQMEGALPNKFFEYMAGGLAMLLTRTHAFGEFENIDDFARFIDPTDVSTLTSQLEYLRDNPDVVNRMKVRSLEEAKRYCGDAAVQRIQEIYEGVCEKIHA